MMVPVAFLITFLISIHKLKAEVYSCLERETTFGKVCVCNSTYCDTIPEVLKLNSGEYQWFRTSADQLGFNSTNGTLAETSSSLSVGTIKIPDLNATEQTILGFGGAFTDATGINVKNLSNATQEVWLKSYFGEEGIQYSIGRVPIAGTDFSTRGYSYCDEEDESLDKFSLESEDLLYKIPLIQKALELRGSDSLNLFASAWSAPPWMKTKNSYSGLASIHDKYLDLWAQYYLKFFDAYKGYNITFWGVTTQNEPFDGLYNSSIPNNGFNSTKMKKWIKESLGPVIRNSSYSDLKIILHDDQRILLPLLHWLVLSDEDVINYADGIGLHWYTDDFTLASFLNLATNNVADSSKELFRLATEACNGYLYSLGLEEHPVKLGSWDRADKYLKSIIQDLSYNFIGWVDWNLALNEDGGPNYINNPVDSPIIVNGTADEFYKQPMFYVLGHFSKFIVSGSKRLSSTTVGIGISSVSFLRPDGKIAVVIRNSLALSQTVTVTIEDQKGVFKISAQSVNTILYTP